MGTYVVFDAGRRITGRHVRKNCLALAATAAQSSTRINDLWGPNTKRRGKGDERTRCKSCFFEAPPLAFPSGYLPRWVSDAATQFGRAPADMGYVYEIFDPAEKLTIVGSTTDLGKRFAAHWRAVSTKPRLGGGAPWLFDKLSANASYEPDWRAELVARQLLKKLEDELRDDRRGADWEVATDY